MKLSEIKTNTLDRQKGNKGFFRQTSVNKGNQEQWINRVLKFDWFYTFKYDSGEFFTLHYDVNGVFSKVNKNFYIKD